MVESADEKERQDALNQYEEIYLAERARTEQLI